MSILVEEKRAPLKGAPFPNTSMRGDSKATIGAIAPIVGAATLSMRLLIEEGLSPPIISNLTTSKAFRPYGYDTTNYGDR